jgi:hypothetical protein
MNKIRKTILVILLSAAVGITYTTILLKNIPESFDWNLEEDEDENY